MPELILKTDAKIVAMTMFDGRLFVATENGVFVKDEDQDVFRPVEFENGQPEQS